MSCKFQHQENGNRIRCKCDSSTTGYCMFQYYCSSKNSYCSTASPSKCKFYEEETIEEKPIVETQVLQEVVEETNVELQEKNTQEEKESGIEGEPEVVEKPKVKRAKKIVQEQQLTDQPIE